jgi:hypothetical protein
MLASELNSFFEKPCRLKLKSGKEVFGVVWEEDSAHNKTDYYFASSDEFSAYKKAKEENNIDACNRLRMAINIDDVVGAEALKGLVPGKNMFL